MTIERTNKSLFLPWFALSLLILLASCTTTRIPVVDSRAVANEKANQYLELINTRQQAKQRVVDLAWPLIAKNREICRKSQARKIGIGFAIPSSPLDRWERAREQSYGFNGYPVAETVAAGSPASNAGIQVGDKFIRVGSFVRVAENERHFAAQAVEKIDELSASAEQFELEVQRGDVRNVYKVESVPVCRGEFTVIDSANVNASTDGSKITMNLGLLRFFDDQAVQSVIAHELAHVVENHVRGTLPRRGVGLFLELLTLSQGVWLGGSLAGVTSAAFQKGLEREADYVSMYLLANAGLDTTNVQNVWREYASANGQSIRGSMTHPNTAERYLTLQAIHNEIQEKIQHGEPLLPNR